MGAIADLHGALIDERASSPKISWAKQAAHLLTVFSVLLCAASLYLCIAESFRILLYVGTTTLFALAILFVTLGLRLIHSFPPGLLLPETLKGVNTVSKRVGWGSVVIFTFSVLYEFSLSSSSLTPLVSLLGVAWSYTWAFGAIQLYISAQFAQKDAFCVEAEESASIDGSSVAHREGDSDEGEEEAV